MSLFFEDTKPVKAFNESFNANTFLQEMVTTKYSEENYEFAKALQEALEEGHELALNEEEKMELANQMLVMEARMEQLKQICSLQEGFGFISWWKVHATGSDSNLGAKVQKKIQNSVKTEADKKQLIADLQKVKSISQSISGTKDKAKGQFWKDVWVAIKSSLATSMIGHLGIIPHIIRIVKNHNGTNDDFVKGIDSLIAEVKAVKVSK